MEDFSVLIGGKAGFGIDKSGAIIGRLLGRLGYRIYIYRDYPSLIRGGHTFSIIRASKERIAAHRDKVDFIIALNQETLALHRSRLKKACFYIFDSERAEPSNENVCGLGLPLGKFLKEENAPEVMRNTCVIGAMARAIGVNFGILQDIIKDELSNDADLNVKVARRGFDAAKELVKVWPLKQNSLPAITGNQAVGLGLIKGGLKAYISYPMTPTSPILHFLAENAGRFNLDVIHPESEIGVMLMALGYSYAGKKAAVGTSGGGFCLMSEGLSFAGMAELPIVVVLGQRPGPSTGLPTYSAQADLHFALNAGQGEFTRFVVAPGDAEEAYYWSSVALNMSWKYQIPAIILSDKNLGESVFNFDIESAGGINEEKISLWDKKGAYKRYSITENGVSPMSFPSERGAIIKIASYEHDEFGVTTEDPEQAKLMCEKRLRKEKFLSKDLENLTAVKTYGDKSADTAILCWGSNKGPALEAARKPGLKLVQPIVLNPFPVKQFQNALSGVKRVICVENNAAGQLAGLIKGHGFNADDAILKYDGRPFSVEELENSIKGAMK